MDKLKKLLGQPEFAGLLCLLGCWLFFRPLIVMFKSASADQVWLSIYLPWIGVVGLVSLISRFAIVDVSTAPDSDSDSDSDLEVESGEGVDG